MTEKIRKIIEGLLKEEPRCKTDNKWLIIRTLQKLGIHFWIDYRDIDKIPAFATITRYKRAIQNQENKFNDDLFPEEGITFETPIRS